MSLSQLAPLLHALPRGEKLMALQLLSADLCAEEDQPLIEGGIYHVHTPEAPPETAAALNALLAGQAADK